MRNERLIHYHKNTNKVLTLGIRTNFLKDSYLPLEEIYCNNFLQKNSCLYSSVTGGYYHFKFNLNLSLNSILSLANATINLIIDLHSNKIFKGNLKSFNINLDSNGDVINSQELIQTFEFEYYLQPQEQLNLAFYHNQNRSLVLNFDSIEFSVFEITDKKYEESKELLTKKELEEKLINYLDIENLEQLPSKGSNVSFKDLKGIPNAFNPKSHEHLEYLKKFDFDSYKKYLKKTLDPVFKESHNHRNSEVLNGFWLEGDELIFNGKRVFNWENYLDSINSLSEEQEGLKEEVSDIHYDLLNVVPEEYFYDLSNHSRWELYPPQRWLFAQWSTVTFSGQHVIRGDTVYRDMTPSSEKWKFYPQVPGLYTVSFFLIFDFPAPDNYLPGDQINIRFGLFKNGSLYSILDHKWLFGSPFISWQTHFRSDIHGIDRILLELGDYIEIKVKHTYFSAIQPPFTLIYGYINIERSDTESTSVDVPVIPIQLQ